MQIEHSCLQSQTLTHPQNWLTLLTPHLCDTSTIHIPYTPHGPCTGYALAKVIVLCEHIAVWLKVNT